MHDITHIEELGIPGAFIASTEFESAAAAQSESLGSQPRAVFVPHPIQDRTDDELKALAVAAMSDIEQSISG